MYVAGDRRGLNLWIAWICRRCPAGRRVSSGDAEPPRGALVRKPEALAIREVDAVFDDGEAAAVRGLLQSLARRERLAVLASAASPAAARGFADRLVAIADGLLVFDGQPADFSDERAAWRFGIA